MRLARILQTFCALLSLPCFVGWIAFSLASIVFFFTKLLDFVPSFANIYGFVSDVLLLALAGGTLYLGWWGWVSLWWMYFFYPPLACSPPRWARLGGFFGAALVVIQFVALLVYDRIRNGTAFSISLHDVVASFPSFILFGGAPLLFLLANINAAQIQRKSLARCGP